MVVSAINSILFFLLEAISLPFGKFQAMNPQGFTLSLFDSSSVIEEPSSFFQKLNGVPAPLSFRSSGVRAPLHNWSIFPRLQYYTPNSHSLPCHVLKLISAQRYCHVSVILEKIGHFQEDENRSCHRLRQLDFDLVSRTIR